MIAILGALLLAATVANAAENPRFVSPNGEMCVVVRRFPAIADFESISRDEYFRRVEAEGAAGEPLPVRGALYRLWPGDYQERLAEFTCDSAAACEDVLVGDDGTFVTHGAFRCDKDAELVTIRAADGSLVRSVRVRDVMTANDQQWLCRGAESDVRFALDDKLRVTMLLTDGEWDDRDARHHTVDIDVGSGAVQPPEGDLCPAAQRIVAEADDGLPRFRTDPDVVVLDSQSLLDRAVERVLPEYPEVAVKARVAGTVGVQVIVGKDGRVEAAYVVKPLPFSIEGSVTTAIRQWQFPPAPSRTSGVLAFRFELIRSPRLLTMR